MRIISGFLGFVGVLLGAFGAHALKPRLLEAGTLATWETAVQYQLFHSVALLGVSLVLALQFAENQRAAAWLRRASWAWCAGIVLFSFSLYWVALGGPRWLWPFAPAGGFSFLLGWAFVALSGLFCQTVRKTPANTPR